MKNTKELTKQEKINKSNLRLFKFYQMFSKDLIFYYAISFLFLTQAKNLTAAQILFIEAFYPISKIVVQFFATSIIDKSPKKFSIVLGNVFISTFFVFMIIAPNMLFCIIANFFLALGFAFKEVTESAFVFDFIDDTPAKKRNLVSKIYGESTSYYFIFTSLSDAVSGFLFIINPYLPLFLGLFFNIVAIIISTFFKEPKNKEPEKLKKEKKYIDELKKGISFILNSNRMKLLIVFNALFYSCISLYAVYRVTILGELEFSSTYTGILYALFGVISAYSAKKSHNIHNNLKNTTLSSLSFLYCLAIITISAVLFFNLPMIFVYFTLLLMMCMQCIVEGPYTIITTQYLSNFTTPRMRTKIYTINSLLSEALYAIVTLVSSLLLNYFSLAFTLVIVGALFTLTFVYLLTKMNGKVGLAPEEYSEQEVYVK